MAPQNEKLGAVYGFNVKNSTLNFYNPPRLFDIHYFPKNCSLILLFALLLLHGFVA